MQAALGPPPRPIERAVVLRGPRGVPRVVRRRRPRRQRRRRLFRLRPALECGGRRKIWNTQAEADREVDAYRWWMCALRRSAKTFPGVAAAFATKRLDRAPPTVAREFNVGGPEAGTLLGFRRVPGLFDPDWGRPVPAALVQARRKAGVPEAALLRPVYTPVPRRLGAPVTQRPPAGEVTTPAGQAAVADSRAKADRCTAQCTPATRWTQRLWDPATAGHNIVCVFINCEPSWPGVIKWAEHPEFATWGEFLKAGPDL